MWTCWRHFKVVGNRKKHGHFFDAPNAFFLRCGVGSFGKALVTFVAQATKRVLTVKQWMVSHIGSFLAVAASGMTRAFVSVEMPTNDARQPVSLHIGVIVGVNAVERTHVM